jgi:hypothetical protein
VVCAVLADELGEAGNEAVADGEGSLGGDVAGGEAGAAAGEHQCGAAGGGAEGGSEAIELVGEEYCLEDVRTGRGEQVGNGWAGEVGLRAGKAAVADGDDDGGAASKRRGGWHISKNRCRLRGMWLKMRK